MSAGSGIKISDDIKDMYNNIHKKSAKPKYRFAILKFNETNTGLDIEQVAEEKDGVKSYNEVISALPNNDVRYMFYDLEYITKSEAKRSKVICVSWHPSGSSVKRKMILASTFSALKAALSLGANETLEGGNASDLDIDTVLMKFGGKSAV